MLEGTFADKGSEHGDDSVLIGNPGFRKWTSTNANSEILRHKLRRSLQEMMSWKINYKLTK